jgi:hypothetical protein
MDRMHLSHQNLLNFLGALNFEFGLSDVSMSFCSRSRKPLVVSFETLKSAGPLFPDRKIRCDLITNFHCFFFAIDR